MTGSCSDYLVFPIERSLPDVARGFLYAFGILYCFLGLSSITARFFLGMENVAQQTRAVVYTDPVSGSKRIKRERIWNCTVADIALLASGTSFPQISLATIEAFTDLGNLSAGGADHFYRGLKQNVFSKQKSGKLVTNEDANQTIAMNLSCLFLSHSTALSPF